MQANAVVRQTYGRPLTIVPETASHLKNKPEAFRRISLALNTDVENNVRPKSFIEKVLFCLEREETLLEQLIGYGICALAILYLLGSILRAVLK